MIRRLDSIRECGIFADYRWDATLPDFASICVIYGSNGTGKTSLASALAGLRHDDVRVDGHERVSLTVEDESGTRTTAGNSDPMFERVAVFSDDYLLRNHRFTGSSSEMDAILTLGERTSEADARLDELRPSAIVALGEKEAAQTRIREANQELERRFALVSQSVVSDLQRAGGIYRSRGSYSVAKVKGRFEESHEEWTLLSDSMLASKKQLVSSDNRNAIQTATASVQVREGIQDESMDALASSPITAVLDTLAETPEASAWVEAGHHFHEGKNQCVYCGSPLTESRKRDIELHFSSEVSDLQIKLDGLLAQLGAIESQVQSKVTSLPERGVFFEDLGEQRDIAVLAIRAEADELLVWVRELRQRLERKRANVLESVDSNVELPAGIDGRALDLVIEEHNARVANHDEEVQAAAVSVEMHYLKDAEVTVAELRTRIRTATTAEAEIAQQLFEIEQEIASLENVDGDPVPSAEALTREVARLLGRDELEFRSQDGRYLVLRNGAPAVGLSAGERTAITLVHFLEAVARSSSEEEKAIVVIDDPVSSLDSNIFMGASTLIWSATVAKAHISQVVVLTHSFELFRQWDIQVDGLHRGRGMRTQHPAQFYELKTRHDSSGNSVIRRPVLQVWPPNETARKKVRSSYHHAFLALAEAKQKLEQDDSLDNRLDAQLLFPNVIRRTLETFMAFKRPDLIGDFTGTMRRSAEMLAEAGYEGNADGLRVQLTRYAHAYSHSDTPLTNEVVNPDEVGPALTAVFTFMRSLDSSHFEGLCEILEIDPDDLAPLREVAA